MKLERREFLITAAMLATVAPRLASSKEEAQMYGLIGKMTAVAGQRDALISILLESVDRMPGCLSYVVARDPTDANAIWITEVWASRADHEASLSLPFVKQAIVRAKPMIASFADSFVTEPIGGHGLSATSVAR